LGWKLLYREELLEEPVIDAHRYTAVVAIHVHIIVTHHGQSFKTPPAYQTCTRGSVRRASGLVQIALSLSDKCCPRKRRARLSNDYL